MHITVQELFSLPLMPCVSSHFLCAVLCATVQCTYTHMWAVVTVNCLFSFRFCCLFVFRFHLCVNL